MALGSVGMSLSDFEALSPAEWHAVYSQWEQTALREEWERVRFLATAAIQPHTRRRLRPQDVLRLAWDNARRPADTPPAAPSTRARAEEMLRRADTLRHATPPTPPSSDNNLPNDC